MCNALQSAPHLAFFVAKLCLSSLENCIANLQNNRPTRFSMLFKLRATFVIKGSAFLCRLRYGAISIVLFLADRLTNTVDFAGELLMPLPCDKGQIQIDQTSQSRSFCEFLIICSCVNAHIMQLFHRLSTP